MIDFEQWYEKEIGSENKPEYEAAKWAWDFQQAKNDELQSRVDGALSQINGITRFINEDNPSDVHALSVTVDCELSRIAHILKGA